MDSGSYVVDSSSLLAPPPRFPLSMTTSRHSLPNLDPNDMVVSLFSQNYITYLFTYLFQRLKYCITQRILCGTGSLILEI